MSVLHCDFESRSAVDLKKAGLYVYAADASTDVWCLCFAFDDAPSQLWIPGDPVPPRIAAHVTNGGIVTAHNAAFERVIWHFIMGPRYGWPEPATNQWRCTMVQALAMALPGGLDNMVAALGSTIRKDMAGHRLMMTMAKPWKVLKPGEAPPKNAPTDYTDRNFWTLLEDGTRILWRGDEDRRNRLYTYCGQDVDAERSGDQHLVRLRPQELDLWHLDQGINDRGICVDENLARRASAIVRLVAERLDHEMASVTDWDVTACSNVSQLKTWIRSKGFETDSLDKGTLAELLCRHDLPDAVRRALELRQEAARASVAKIDALLNGTSADSRARGLLQFLAAATGRWGGRRFQPQNIKRPEMGQADIDAAIEIILQYPAPRAIRIIELLYGPVLAVISDILRGLLVAAPGKRLVAADYSNIEGRVLAWLAGEAWKLDAFKAADRGDGPDVYKITAGDLLGKVPKDITKGERQDLGKVPELASGYQGGHGAYIKMGATGAVLARIVAATRAVTSPEAWQKAENRFDARSPLTVEEWTALRIVIDRWRAKHPMIKQFWKDLESAAMEAVVHKGRQVNVGRVAFRVVGSFLWMQIPSGRAICMPYPAITWKEMSWLDDDGEPVFKEVVSFKTVDSVTNQWVTAYCYGGQLSNYATQGTARDIMAEAMPRVEAAGYPVVLSVHDELVCEVDEDFGGADEFEKLMTVLPKWADGLPVSAEAWEGARYHK